MFKKGALLFLYPWPNSRRSNLGGEFLPRQCESVFTPFICAYSYSFFRQGFLLCGDFLGQLPLLSLNSFLTEWVHSNRPLFTIISYSVDDSLAFWIRHSVVAALDTTRSSTNIRLGNITVFDWVKNSCY